MGRPNYLDQVRERIDTATPGAVFIPSDFFDIAEAVKINMCLNRLKESGELIFIMRGIYAKPRYSALLKKMYLRAQMILQNLLHGITDGQLFLAVILLSTH